MKATKQSKPVPRTKQNQAIRIDLKPQDRCSPDVYERSMEIIRVDFDLIRLPQPPPRIHLTKPPRLYTYTSSKSPLPSSSTWKRKFSSKITLPGAGSAQAASTSQEPVEKISIPRHPWTSMDINVYILYMHSIIYIYIICINGYDAGPREMYLV